MFSLKTDPSFDYNQTEKYKLSIQVNPDGFSFSVLQPNAPKLIALGWFPVTVSSEKFLGRRFTEWFENQNILNKKYAETRLSWFSPKYTLIPSAFYEYKQQKLAIDLNFGEQHGNAVRDNYLPDIKANLIFTVPNALTEAFKKIAPDGLIHHPVALFHRKIQEKYSEEKNKVLLALYFREKAFSLLLYQDGEWVQNNNFSYIHQNDVVYYVLSVLKTLKVSSSKTFLLLAGHIKENDTVHALLSGFFGKTAFFEPSCQYNKTVFDEPLHLYLPLI